MPSDSLRAEIIKERSGVVAVDLLQIDNAALSQPIRLANNTTDIVSRSETFRGVLFTLSRGSEGTAPGETTINIFDPDQQILFELEKIPPVENTATNVTFWLVSNLGLDDIELTEVYELKGFEVDDSGFIVMTVLSDPFLGVTIPAHSFTPDLYPGLHATIEGE